MAVPFVALPAAAPLFGPEAALVGAGVGLLVGLTSMGAGALLTPALVLLLGVPPRIAVGSDVLIAGVMKLFGGGAYAVRRVVHWPTVLHLLLGSIPGAHRGQPDEQSNRGADERGLGAEEGSGCWESDERDGHGHELLGTAGDADAKVRRTREGAFGLGCQEPFRLRRARTPGTQIGRAHV